MRICRRRFFVVWYQMDRDAKRKDETSFPALGLPGSIGSLYAGSSVQRTGYLARLDEARVRREAVLAERGLRTQDTSNLSSPNDGTDEQAHYVTPAPSRQSLFRVVGALGLVGVVFIVLIWTFSSPSVQGLSQLLSLLRKDPAPEVLYVIPASLPINAESVRYAFVEATIQLTPNHQSIAVQPMTRQGNPHPPTVVPLLHSMQPNVAQRISRLNFEAITHNSPVPSAIQTNPIYLTEARLLPSLLNSPSTRIDDTRKKYRQLEMPQVQSELAVPAPSMQVVMDVPSASFYTQAHPHLPSDSRVARLPSTPNAETLMASPPVEGETRNRELSDVQIPNKVRKTSQKSTPITLGILSEAPPLFKFSSIRLLVFAPSALSEKQVEDSLDQVRVGGFSVHTTQPVGVSISTTQIRYYHTTDRIAAEYLSDISGATLRDFTDFSPRPPSGTLEYWLSGRARATKTPSLRRRTTIETALEAVGASLNRWLR